MLNHPNAIVGGLFGGSGLGTAVIWGLDHWNYAASWPVEAKTAIAGGVAAVVLFVGRNGVVGTYKYLKERILHGSDTSSSTNAPILNDAPEPTAPVTS